MTHFVTCFVQFYWAETVMFIKKRQLIILCISPWAKTPKFRISYHSGEQRLSYIFRNLSSSTLFLSMIAVSTEQLSCLNHVIKWRHQYQVMLLFITDYCKIPSSNLHFMINDGLKLIRNISHNVSNFKYFFKDVFVWLLWQQSLFNSILHWGWRGHKVPG